MDQYLNYSFSVYQLCDLMQCRHTENCRFQVRSLYRAGVGLEPEILWLGNLCIANWVENEAQWCKLEPIPETSLSVAFRHTSFSGQFFFRVVLHYRLEEPGLGERVILKWIFRKWDRGTWTGLIFTENRDGWRAVVNAVINLRVALNAGNFLTSWGPVSFSRRTLLRGVS